MVEYKPISEDLRDGPVKDRRCTDVICGFIFVVFVAAMIAIGVFGFVNGDPNLVLYPYDSSGNQCGRDGTVTADYPYLYWVNPTDEVKYTVCTKSCPISDSDIVECFANSWVKTCTFTVNNNEEISYYPPYKSKQIFKRGCLPDASEVNDKYEKYMNYLGDEQFTQYASDIMRCWSLVLGVLGIAVVISILYMVFLRYCVGCALWISFAAIIGIFVLFGLFLEWTAQTKYSGSENEKTWTTLRVVSITCYCLAGLAVLLIICMRKRIELAVAIMKSASLFIGDVWQVLLVPIVMFLISVLTFVFWVLALTYLYSSGEVEQKDKYSSMVHIKFDDRLRNAFWFEFLGILWINSFKVAFTEFIIATACCVWYFNPNKNESQSPICKGIKYGLLYHLGSIAFGSFILALVTLIKWILRIITEKIYREAGDGNAALKCVCGCLNCLVSCFERFIKFLNNQAYIRIAMTGESFCTAAYNAFMLVVNNAARFAALGGVGSIFNFLGKLLITSLTSYIGYLIITNTDYYADRISSPMPPTVVFIIVCYLVSSLFMTVYSMAAESIIQAFLIDEELHKDTVFAPEPMVKFMKEHRDEKESKGCC